MPWIDALEIDDVVLEKIEVKHAVSVDEVEEVCLGDDRHVRRGRDGLYKVFGRTAGGRYLLVVLAGLGGGVWRVVTARRMTDDERRLFQRETSGR